MGILHMVSLLIRTALNLVTLDTGHSNT